MFAPAAALIVAAVAVDSPGATALWVDVDRNFGNYTLYVDGRAWLVSAPPTYPGTGGLTLNSYTTNVKSRDRIGNYSATVLNWTTTRSRSSPAVLQTSFKMYCAPPPQTSSFAQTLFAQTRRYCWASLSQRNADTCNIDDVIAILPQVQRIVDHILTDVSRWHCKHNAVFQHLGRGACNDLLALHGPCPTTIRYVEHTTQQQRQPPRQASFTAYNSTSTWCLPIFPAARYPCRWVPALELVCAARQSIIGNCIWTVC